MNISEKNKLDSERTERESKPNETGGFYFSSHVKLTDPNTNEVLLQQRGDN